MITCMDTEKVATQILTLYKSELKNLDIPHPKILILFSGPPNSGKSTVARQLEEYLHAVRLENDRLRELITNTTAPLSLDEKAEFVYELMDHLRQEISSIANGLWVMDSSIDRQYQRVFDFAAKYGFATIIIAMSIPEQTHKEWITRSGDKSWATVDQYLTRMPMLRDQQQAFLAAYTPDIVLEPGYDIQTVINKVTKLIDNRA